MIPGAVASGAHARVRAAIDRLPRFRLAHLPTPLQPLPRLSQELSGPPILIKRDDLTGLAFGGNKTRKLEFFVGEALQQGCNVLVAGGGRAQSNHARQAAAAARAAGLRPILVLQGGGHHQEPQGNQLLDMLLDAELHFVPADEVQRAGPQAVGDAMDRIADRERAAGNRPYVIYRSSVPLGTVGYVECAIELLLQLADQQLDVRDIYLASSWGTQAGLLLGALLLDRDWRVNAVDPRAETRSTAEIAALAHETAELLGIRSLDVGPLVHSGHAPGPGYGYVTREGREAIELLARTEGIFLDPVYTAKAFAVLVRRIRDGELDRRLPVVFLHTGGLPALFAYRDELLTPSESDTPT